MNVAPTLLVATGDIESITTTLFVDIAVVILTARVMGALFRRLRQPPVVGEILAGILLGPTLLGLFPGDIPGRLFPTEVRPFLGALAQLGLIVFMFIVGLELDTKLIRGKERIAATISIASVALPFALGFGLALILHRTHGVIGGEDVEFLPFALFIGASMSVTAFPVLARILAERGMHRTAIGALALASAAVDDILAWSLLAVVLAVVASESLLDVPLILVESVAFAAFMFWAVRPQLAKLVHRYERAGRLTPDVLAVILVGVLVSSWVTSKIGIHSIFGAFVFGAIMPRAGAEALTHHVLEQLENVTVLLLLPIFFIVTGLGVDVGGIGAQGGAELLLILLIATAGKFVGATAAARAMGLRFRRAAAVGTLMNTRGLTELVLLNVGRQKGVLDDELFTLLVVMAIVTTVMTEPVLRIVYPDHLLARDIADAERERLGEVEAYRALVRVDVLSEAAALAEISRDLVRAEPRSEVVMSRFIVTGAVELGAGLASGMSEVAETLDVLGRLRAEGSGPNVVVSAQLSRAPARDFASQAGSVEADVVVVAAGSHEDELALENDVVRVELVADLPWEDAPTAIVLHPSDDLDGAAAAEIAGRLALGSGARLTVIDPGSRSRSAVVDALRAAGLQLGTATTAEEGSLIVTGASTRARARSEGARAVLAVQAKPTKARPASDLLDRLEQLPQPSTAPAAED